MRLHLDRCILIFLAEVLAGCPMKLHFVRDVPAGIQCLDPHLCNPTICGEHPQIWPATQIPGCAAETKPEEYNKAAETSCLPLWLSWCAHLILQENLKSWLHRQGLSPCSEVSYKRCCMCLCRDKPVF